MRSKAQAWLARALIKDSQDSLEEDVAEDAEADTGVWLDAPEALLSGLVERSVVDVLSWDLETLAANRDVEVWRGRAAWEDVASLHAVVLSSTDLAVVGAADVGWQVKEGGAGVSDGDANRAAGGVAGSDGVSTCVELPEAVLSVDVGVGDAARVLGVIDET